MKINFNKDDDLPSLKKPLKFPTMTIVAKSVFEDDKFYPQIYLDKCLYDLVDVLQKNLMFREELTLTKYMPQKYGCFVIFGILKMLVTNLYGMFVINVKMC